MQFILTQQELDDLVPKAKLTTQSRLIEEARITILKLAKFDCIHNETGSNRGGYCDDCPCSPLNHKDYQLWSAVCTLSKDYSQ